MTPLKPRSNNWMQLNVLNHLIVLVDLFFFQVFRAWIHLFIYSLKILSQHLNGPSVIFLRYSEVYMLLFLTIELRFTNPSPSRYPGRKYNSWQVNQVLREQSNPRLWHHHLLVGYPSKSCGSARWGCVLLANRRWALVFFIVSSNSCFATLPWHLPSSTLTLSEAGEIYRSFNVSLGSSMTTWVSH